MQELLKVTEVQGIEVADSRLIAQELNIQHKNLLETIKTHQKSIEDNFGQLTFQTETVQNSVGAKNEIKIAYLTEDQCLFITSLSKNTERVVSLKAKIVKSFQAARKLVATTQAELSRMDILEMAMKAERERMALENQNRQLMQKNEVLSEKAEYVDKVLSSESGHATTIIAKELGMSAVTLNKLLEGLGVQYMTKAGEWVLKAAHQNKGYVESRTHAYLSNDKFTTKTKIYFVWTELGRKFIHELVTRKLGGINSNMA